MLQFQLGKRSLPLAGIVFDKDGTLLDFNYLWSNLIERWLTALAGAANDQLAGTTVEDLRRNLDATLGYDSAAGEVVPDSPLAVATMPRLFAVAMTILFQAGLPWHTAETLVEAVWRQTYTAIPTDRVRPVGDVAGTCARLHEAGLRLAVLTSDDRDSTEQTLPLLQIERYIDVLVCGDDGLPPKPSPEGLLSIATRWRVPPGMLLMVGDTASDMETGRRAGVGGCIGITGGAGETGRLADLADLLLPSIAGLLSRLKK